MKKAIGPGRVVAMFVVGLFCAGLLIFTGIANLKLLTRIYPDPEFVAFGLLALEGGTVVWTTVSFLTSKKSAHFGICLIGLAVDTLLSCAGFMYELSFTTGTSLIVQLPVIYVIGFAVVFNVGVALCYKLVPEQGNVITAPVENHQIGYRRSNDPKNEEQVHYQIQEQRGEPARPLASSHRQSNDPKEEPIELDSQATIEPPQIEQPKARELKPLPPMRKPQKTSQQVSRNPERGMLSEGVSTLTQKLSGFTRHGKMADHARGKTSQTIDENM